MAEVGKRAGVVALLLGGLALVAPSFLSGITRLSGGESYGGMAGSYAGTVGGGAGMGGYGGMMGGYGGMMGGYGGMMGGYGGMMGGMVGGIGGTGGFGTAGTVGTIFGLLTQLGFLLLLVGAGYLLYRALVDDDSADYLGASDTAIEELRLAYARGELSGEEYEKRRTRLRQGGDR